MSLSEFRSRLVLVLSLLQFHGGGLVVRRHFQLIYVAVSEPCHLLEFYPNRASLQRKHLHGNYNNFFVNVSHLCI